MSALKVGDLINDGRLKNRMHFHPVIWDKCPFKLEELHSLPKPMRENEEAFTMWQIGITKKARMMGFFHQDVFNVVLIDMDHRLYGSDKRRSLKPISVDVEMFEHQGDDGGCIVQVCAKPSGLEWVETLTADGEFTSFEVINYPAPDKNPPSDSHQSE